MPDGKIFLSLALSFGKNIKNVRPANAGRTGGDSDRTRTCNLLIRSQVLYPIKLRSHLRMQRYEKIFACQDFCP